MKVLYCFCLLALVSLAPNECIAQPESCGDDVDPMPSPAGVYYTSQGRRVLDLRDDGSGVWYYYNTGGGFERGYGIEWARDFADHTILVSWSFSITYPREEFWLRHGRFSQQQNGDLIYLSQEHLVNGEAQQREPGADTMPFGTDYGHRYSQRR